MENNGQYWQMLEAVKEKLEVLEPLEIARKTGFAWNDGSFETNTLGIPIQIHWPDCEITPKLTMWHHLTILQYMAGATGISLTGHYISLCEFREGGLVRGSSFDRENDRAICLIGKHDMATIRKAAEKMGGTPIPEKSDISIHFWFLPKFPMVLNLWLADEDFPASGKVLLDAAVENFLQVEAAGTATGILLEKLREKAAR